ncbi:uncharacterized protein [Diadema setosum]|uniref:uncharacterized protein isoform X2 n=1 Tax=Diadema setosum TaxID=31175 RepID=UPI003B3A4711
MSVLHVFLAITGNFVAGRSIEHVLSDLPRPTLTRFLRGEVAEQDEEGTGDEVEDEAPGQTVSSKSYWPYERWSKFKFTILEFAIAIVFVINIIVCVCLLKTCKGWQTQAQGVAKDSKRYGRKYVGLNPDSEPSEEEDDEEDDDEEDNDEDD